MLLYCSYRISRARKKRVVIGVVLEISKEKSYCCIGYIQCRALAYVVLWNISRAYKRSVYCCLLCCIEESSLLLFCLYPEPRRSVVLAVVLLVSRA